MTFTGSEFTKSDPHLEENLSNVLYAMTMEELISHRMETYYGYSTAGADLCMAAIKEWKQAI